MKKQLFYVVVMMFGLVAAPGEVNLSGQLKSTVSALWDLVQMEHLSDGFKFVTSDPCEDKVKRILFDGRVIDDAQLVFNNDSTAPQGGLSVEVLIYKRQDGSSITTVYLLRDFSLWDHYDKVNQKLPRTLPDSPEWNRNVGKEILGFDNQATLIDFISEKRKKGEKIEQCCGMLNSCSAPQNYYLIPHLPQQLQLNNLLQHYERELRQYREQQRQNAGAGES
jgi:hypothetical protein